MSKLLFILFNLLISSNLLFHIVFLILIYVVSQTFIFKYNGAAFGIFIWLSIFFVLFVLFFKAIIFIFLNQIKLKNIFVIDFFYKIKKDKSFRLKILLYSILSDFSFIFMTPLFFKIYNIIFTQSNLSYFNLLGSYLINFIFWGGGITLCYLSLIFWLKLKKEI